jgi:SAM-dependent methyltransferase
LVYEPFLTLLPDNSHILDAGCGSGRDSLYFLQNGYKVKASKLISKKVGVKLTLDEQVGKRRCLFILQPDFYLSYLSNPRIFSFDFN